MSGNQRKEYTMLSMSLEQELGNVIEKNASLAAAVHEYKMRQEYLVKKMAEVDPIRVAL